jgi:hypothetical protein
LFQSPPLSPCRWPLLPNLMVMEGITVAGITMAADITTVEDTTTVADSMFIMVTDIITRMRAAIGTATGTLMA